MHLLIAVFALIAAANAAPSTIVQGSQATIAGPSGTIIANTGSITDTANIPATVIAAPISSPIVAAPVVAAAPIVAKTFITPNAVNAAVVSPTIVGQNLYSSFVQPGFHQQGLLQSGLFQQGLIQPGLYSAGYGLDASNLFGRSGLLASPYGAAFGYNNLISSSGLIGANLVGGGGLLLR